MTKFSHIPLAEDSTPDDPRSYWDRLMMEQEAREHAAGGAICPPIGSQNMGDTGQVANAFKHLDQVPAAWRASQDAQEAARQRFPNLPDRHNDAADAYRHFIWNADMARSIGPKSAADFANSHEVSGDDPPAEHRMDLYNNAVGRAMATDPRFAHLSPQQLAELAYRNACLRTSVK